MRKKSLSRVAAILVLFLSYPSASLGTIIEVEIDALDANRFLYGFELRNDDVSEGIEEFAIYFDVDVFAAIVDAPAPDGWDPLVIQPEPAFPDDGFVDYLFLVDPLALNDILSFDITVELIGGAAPGNLFFEVYDFDTFSLIDTGFTQLREPPTSVSEPGTLMLLVVGFAALILPRGMRQRHRAT